MTLLTDQKNTTRLFELDIQNQTFAEAHQLLMQTARTRGNASRVVVTPNVDHIVRLDQQAEFKQLYSTSDLIFADGMPVVWASKITGHPLPERVTGADLFVSLCRTSANEGLSVFVVGGMPGQETELLAAFARVYPGLRVDLFCPSMQFTPEGIEADEAIRRIRAAKPHIVFICLGMPKQEYFAFRYRREESTDNAPLLMCVGAAMEFALGQKQRAPLWMQRIGMEWFWRLASEPRRLWQRYTTQGVKFFGIFFREYRKQKSQP
ncbi:WecB/TagA/CpsF family glycosyltransferase [Undibacterium crateris]|uniref:WecB/TagA/CpsF family glycosyltransferase n=1 Tax=Undibacterium crateris TaxID=2528175 RepID=UPI00138A5360|nr:WecB/TagA/CpsF family glycosyltransferase [Undibacterium crateris]NDI84450.1 WecB/TagA/CpsF family glycosyltransferase [Undibacterium crateris]